MHLQDLGVPLVAVEGFGYSWAILGLWGGPWKLLANTSAILEVHSGASLHALRPEVLAGDNLLSLFWRLAGGEALANVRVV